MESERRTSSWRIGAKIISILDMIGCIIVFAVCIYVICMMILALITNDGAKSFRATAVFLSIGIVIAILLNSLQLWASVSLFKATDLNTDTKVALEGAKFWRVIAILCIILILFGCIARPIQNLISLVIKVIMFAVVHMFIRDLRKSFGPIDKTKNGDFPSVP